MKHLEVETMRMYLETHLRRDHGQNPLTLAALSLYGLIKLHLGVHEE